MTQKLPVPAVDFSFNEVSDSKVKDYDYKEYDKADEFIDNYQTRLNANNAANKNKVEFVKEWVVKSPKKKCLHLQICIPHRS